MANAGSEAEGQKSRVVHGSGVVCDCNSAVWIFSPVNKGYVCAKCTMFVDAQTFHLKSGTLGGLEREFRETLVNDQDADPMDTYGRLVTEGMTRKGTE